jgi:hypothetical protein
MVSYWKNTKEVYVDDGLTLIIGWYDHKNQSGIGDKALGIHWGDYPSSHGVLSPCVIPESTRNAILSGLLHQAVSRGEKASIDTLIEAIEFLR